MKVIKTFLLALFVGLISHVSAQENLNDLAAAIHENPDATVELVAEAVAANPDQVNSIVTRLLAQFPNLAQAIIRGAIAGLPQPLAEDEVVSLVVHAITQSPGLAPEIVVGARQATDGIPGMHQAILLAARNTLVAIGISPFRTSGATPDVIQNDTLRISPAN